MTRVYPHSTTCLEDEAHVEAGMSGLAVEPRLEVAHGLVVEFHDVRVDLRAGEPQQHLLARERFVIPVPSDLRVVVPPDKEIRVSRRSRANDGSLAAQRSRRDPPRPAR